MEPRKPNISASWFNPELNRALLPVKVSLDLITGASTAELFGLKDSATLPEVIAKINEVIARMNASGKVKC